MVNDSEGRAYVEHCADVMEGFTFAAEFRHKSWFSERARESMLDERQTLFRECGCGRTQHNG